MHSLRTHYLVHRLVLAWFVLFTFLVALGPLLGAASTDLICSAKTPQAPTGALAQGKLVPLGGHSLSCPACLVNLLAAPANQGLGFQLPPLQAIQPDFWPDNGLRTLRASAPVARGPPVVC